jgi:uroporphyrin-III C-methyltransferase
MKQYGNVTLVGAGPGDPDLLTLRAVRALEAADVVLHDDLVNPGVLRYARAGARIVAVGKRGGCRSTPQAFIERLMIRLAKHGQQVVRVKGGDPFVFGRGGEEVEALRTAGISVSVVPGITAGLGATSAVGIPVTHRAHCHGVTLVTGHTRDGVEPNWTALAHSGTTLVIYMGMGKLGSIVDALLAAGMSRAISAAIIQDGTLMTQRHVAAPLVGIVEAARLAELRSPALIVIGDVAQYAQQTMGECAQTGAVA